MTNTYYERLSALDAHFLQLEDEGVHMHVAVILICDAKPLTLEDGRLDADRIRSFLASRLHTIPRYRQRLARIPVERHPVWVDDSSFKIQYHVRHVSLPRPGDERQLKRLIGLLMSQKLDHGKPLWEMWVIEGLDGGRFAILARCHHSMVDEIAGVGVLRALLRPEPNSSFRPAPRRPLPGAQVALGNRVVMLVASLPVGERDPRRRLERVIATTRKLKASHVPRGAELIEEIADWTTTSVVTEMMRLATRLRAFNLIVTNVPGPPVQLFLLEAPLLEAFPLVPLYENQAMGIALLSYAGALFWGLSSDWDRVPDLHDIVRGLANAFEELRKAA